MQVCLHNVIGGAGMSSFVNRNTLHIQQGRNRSSGGPSDLWEIKANIESDQLISPKHF